MENWKVHLQPICLFESGYRQPEIFQQCVGSLPTSVHDMLVGKSMKRLESIIRLIPGGYRNGTWQQLDAFFGMYYQPDTNTISHCPPDLC